MHAVADDTVRILAIGNSFSEDAVEQNLHELAQAGGRNTVIANIFYECGTVDRREDQLYHLSHDRGEYDNVAEKNRLKVRFFKQILEEEKSKGVGMDL